MSGAEASLVILACIAGTLVMLVAGGRFVFYIDQRGKHERVKRFVANDVRWDALRDARRECMCDECDLELSRKG